MTPPINTRALRAFVGESWAPELQLSLLEELDRLRAAARDALGYFDTALMCGADLSDLAEPLRQALGDEP